MENQTRKVIINAFHQVMQKHKRLEKIYVTDIVKLANISRASFYNHFNSVEELIEEINQGNIKMFVPQDKFLNQSDLSDYLKYVFFKIKEGYEQYQQIYSEDIMPFLNRLKKEICNKIQKMLNHQLKEHQLISLNIYIEGLFNLIIKSFKSEWDIDLIKLEENLDIVIQDFITSLIK